MSQSPERDGSEQLSLPLELREPVPTPWWAEALVWKTEGNQDTMHWGA